MGDDVNRDHGVVVAIQPIQLGTFDAVLELLVQQQERRKLRDGRLPRLTDAEIRADLSRLAKSGPAIIASVNGRIYACAFPSMEIYQPDDDGLAYFQRETGVAHGLALRDDSTTARTALAALLRLIIEWWERSGAAGGKLVWPSADLDITRELAAVGIIPDAYIEHHVGDTVAGRLLKGQAWPRFARRDDFDAAVALNSMVLDEHVRVSPFARWVDGVEDRFAKRFLTAMIEPPPRRALFFVAELDDQVSAMAECEIETHVPRLDATFPSGTMGYIHVFGVDKNMRRRGVGTALASFVIGELRSRGVSGIRLLVSHYNHPSRMFWQHMGLGEVWRLYQTHQLRAG
jgi:GNAT superfamily N-acetyltransferase